MNQRGYDNSRNHPDYYAQHAHVVEFHQKVERTVFWVDCVRKPAETDEQHSESHYRFADGLLFKFLDYGDYVAQTENRDCEC